MKPKIFISHASEDRLLANLIGDVLKARYSDAVDIFNTSDAHTLEPGDHWKEAIRQAVTSSAVVCAVLTESSNLKPWIYWESGGAYYGGIKVIPLLGPELRFDELQVVFPDIQAVKLLSIDDLGKWITSIDVLVDQRNLSQFDPHPLHNQLRTAFAKVGLSGKIWLEAAKPKIKQFLQSIGIGKADTIRIISYTGETTASELSRFVAEHKRPGTTVEIEVMVRSEFSGFPSRSFDPDFNRVIRWRTARAKAEWYRLTNYNRAHDGVIVSVRDYGWDPMPKFLMLGDSGGFFGQYAIDSRHELSEHPNIRASRDWVSESTDMVYIGSNQSSFLRSQVQWFKLMWMQATPRTNEAYRIKRSDALWTLLKNKPDRSTADILEKWGGKEREWARVGNLALPRHCSETSEEFVDVIGCAVTERRKNRTVVLCEVRNPHDSWEGAGKTKAYLSLIGLSPAFATSPSESTGNWEEHLLKRILETPVDWTAREAKFALYASDFFWASVRERRLVISPPEGELAFGLWDVTRHLVRQEVEKLNQWEDGLHRSLNRHQTKLFEKLSLEDLASRYVLRKSQIVEPELLFVLENTNCEQQEREVVDTHNVQSILKRVLRSGPNHRSNFWTRTPDELQRLTAVVEKLVDSLDPERLPRVVHITGSSPFEIKPAMIGRWLQ